MIYFKDQYATVWEVEDKNTYCLVKMSTSRKNKDTGNYINSNWSYVRFVGDAGKNIKGVQRQTRILIKAGCLSWESFIDAQGNKAWAKTPQLTVFNFEFTEDKRNQQQASGFDTPPAIDEDDVNTESGEEDLPF